MKVSTLAQTLVVSGDGIEPPTRKFSISSICTHDIATLSTRNRDTPYGRVRTASGPETKVWLPQFEHVGLAAAVVSCFEFTVGGIS
jgi:hypothetical protein